MIIIADIKSLSIDELKSEKRALMASSNYLAGLISDIQDNKEALDHNIEEIDKLLNEKESSSKPRHIIGFCDRT